jgi:hypothetical protein
MKLFRRNTTLTSTTEPTPEELADVAAVRAHGGAILFGAPTRCPHCRSYGLVDHVDAVAGVAKNRCPACRRTWRITRAALAAHRASVAPPSNPVAAPVGDGILIRGLAAA